MIAVLYIFAMILSLLMLRVSAPRNVWGIVVFICFLFGCIGFCMVPRDGLYVDTVRFFQTLVNARAFGGDSVFGAWKYLMDFQGYSATPVIGFIIAVCAQFESNGWLLFVAAFADVFSGLYLVVKVSQRYNSKSILLFGAAFFFMVFNFNAAVSGVRMNMACGLACCIAYRSLVEGRRGPLAYVAYVLLALIHPFSLAVACMDVVVTLFGHSKTVLVIVDVGLLCQKLLQNLIFALFSVLSFVPFFASLSFKSTQYFGEGAYIFASTPFSRLRAILLFVALLWFCIFVLRKTAQVDKNYASFITMYLCLCLGSFSDEQLFSRCVSILLFVSLPYISRLWSILKKGGWGITMNLLPFITSCALVAYMVICLVDNMRAAVRFQVVVIDPWASLLLGIALPVSLLAGSLLAARSSIKAQEENNARP